MSGGCRRCAFCGPESLPDGAARRERGECEGGGLRSRPGTQVLNQAPAHTACGSTPQTTPTCTPRAQASPATRVGESAVQRTRTVQYSTGQYRTCTGQYVLDRQCAPRTYTQTHTYITGECHSLRHVSVPALKNLSHRTSWKLKISVRTARFLSQLRCGGASFTSSVSGIQCGPLGRTESSSAGAPRPLRRQHPVSTFTV